MRRYPLLLDLRGLRCLVVGAGAVGGRKITALLACEPCGVTVIDPAPDPSALWREHPAVRLLQRSFQPDDVRGHTLVFAATPVREVNRLVAESCRAAGILCNVADAPEESGFFVPATVEREGVTLTVSTAGASPALAKAIKEDLELWLGQRYAGLARLLEALRGPVLALGLGSGRNAEIFRALCGQPLRDRLVGAILARDAAKLRALLRGPLPPALYPWLDSPLKSWLEETPHELD